MNTHVEDYKAMINDIVAAMLLIACDLLKTNNSNPSILYIERDIYTKDLIVTFAHGDETVVVEENMLPDYRPAMKPTEAAKKRARAIKMKEEQELRENLWNRMKSAVDKEDKWKITRSFKTCPCCQENTVKIFSEELNRTIWRCMNPSCKYVEKER